MPFCVQMTLSPHKQQHDEQNNEKIRSKSVQIRQRVIHSILEPLQEFISFEHINPKMGHLKCAHLAANSNKRKDWTKVILQHPQACNQHLQDLSDMCNAIWDSGASACITNDKKDFVGWIKETQNGKANGISGAMEITGSGKVRWSLINTAGELQLIELQCCCAPSAA